MQLSKSNIQSLETTKLQALQADLFNELETRFPNHFLQLDSEQRQTFIQNIIASAQAVWVEAPEDIKRFSVALFKLEYIIGDKQLLQYFTRVMLSEDSVEARLLFIENNLIR